MRRRGRQRSVTRYGAWLPRVVLGLGHPVPSEPPVSSERRRLRRPRPIGAHTDNRGASWWLFRPPTRALVGLGAGSGASKAV